VGYKDPEKNREHFRRWRSRNLEKDLERNRRYYAENVEKKLEYKRRWRAAKRLEAVRSLGLDVDRVPRSDPRTRLQKLQAMAAQTASPHEAEIARRLLAREH
jgi:tRNA A-37 threonylcarbamoyl transferase component Bud32